MLRLHRSCQSLNHLQPPPSIRPLPHKAPSGPDLMVAPISTPASGGEEKLPLAFFREKSRDKENLDTNDKASSFKFELNKHNYLVNGSVKF